MRDDLENFHRLHRRAYTGVVGKYKLVEPMPPSTLTNTDGTPYQAGYDLPPAQQKLQEALGIMEEEIAFPSKKTGEQLARACQLVREALQLL